MAVARRELFRVGNDWQHRVLNRTAVEAERMEQLARRRLEQRRGKNIERAEGDPDLAQERAHFLGQMLDPGLLARDIAMPRDEIEQ